MFLSSLQKTFMHLRAVIMLPLHFCFSLRTIIVSLFFSYSSCLLNLRWNILPSTRHCPTTPHIVGFRDSKLDSSLELCFPLISFPSRQILSHMMRLFFISWHLEHGSLALGTYILADIHVNVHIYSCIFSIGKKLLLLSLVLLWNKHPAQHLFRAFSLTSLLNGFKQSIYRRKLVASHFFTLRNSK